MVICILVHKKFHYRCKKFNILAITQQILAIHASRKKINFHAFTQFFFRNSRIHATKKADSRIHANRWGAPLVPNHVQGQLVKCPRVIFIPFNSRIFICRQLVWYVHPPSFDLDWQKKP